MDKTFWSFYAPDEASGTKRFDHFFSVFRCSFFFFSPLPLCLPRNVSCLLPQTAETDTKTDFVVDAGFTTKVDYQTTSKNVQNQGKSSHFTGSEKKQGYDFALRQEFSNRP